MDPELLETGILNKKNEIYSIGALYYKMLYGKMPQKNEKNELEFPE